MTRTVFVAGATGAIGARLTPLLVSRGYRVLGLTRAAEKAPALWARGAVAVVGNVFDAAGLTQMMRAARPDAVIHMLTDLPQGLDPSKMEDAVARNARIRSEGTANLVAAARAAGVGFIVAQSIAWAYRPSDALPYTEEASLDADAKGSRAVSVGGVIALENAVMNAPDLKGAVLRFGQLFGPGTGVDDATGKKLPLHVDAAAWATVLALEAERPGIYNIVGPNPEVSADKARRELSWTSESRPTEAQRR
jgi:nucleoside-diphosphate-sugar epimerase